MCDLTVQREKTKWGTKILSVTFSSAMQFNTGLAATGQAVALRDHLKKSE